MKKNGLKKGISMAMAAAMAMSVMVMPVSAADNTPNDKLQVGYTETASFVLNIPTDVVNLSETEEKEAAIGLKSINVGTKERVEIKVSEGITDGKVTLTDVNDGANTATSKVSLSTENIGNSITPDTVVGLFKGTSTAPLNGTGVLYFSAIGDVPAGSYSGRLVFTAKIESEGNTQ